MRMTRFTLTLALLLSAGSLPRTADACEFCTAPSLTLAEQLDQADAVLLVKWVSAQKAKPAKDDSDEPAVLARTTFEVSEIVKNSKSGFEKKEKVTIPEYHAGQPGDLAMLLGLQGTRLEWGAPIDVSTASFNYIKKSPGPDEPLVKRLEFFLEYLEFPDDLVANDAYGEFASAPFVEIRKLSEKFPRERLRKWVTNPNTAVTRLGLYGLMLGLCGNEEDAKLIKDYVTQSTQDFRLGIDGIMAGYLLLTGEEGLKVLEETKLVANAKVPFSETYAAMQAIRFNWNYGDRISKNRLKKSMRLLLERPELTDLVIADLARWKDWEVQEDVMKLYGKKEFDIPSIKRAIVRYMLVCSKDTEEDQDLNPKSDHAATAKKHLAELRKIDPKTVQQAERFFYIN